MEECKDIRGDLQIGPAPLCLIRLESVEFNDQNNITVTGFDVVEWVFKRLQKNVLCRVPDALALCKIFLFICKTPLKM